VTSRHFPFGINCDALGVPLTAVATLGHAQTRVGFVCASSGPSRTHITDERHRRAQSPLPQLTETRYRGRMGPLERVWSPITG
jgi:hypothetical protein